MKIVTRTGVSAILSAAHRSKDGVMHGHTWEIIAWWDEVFCAVEQQQELEKYLSIFDHTILAENVSWGEALARAILQGMQCSRVDVRRPLEGLYASAEIVG